MSQPKSKVILTCPTCRTEHEVFWLVHKGGKRELVYRCNKIEHTKKWLRTNPDGEPVEEKELRFKTGVLPVPDPVAVGAEAVANARIEWTRAYKKEQQDKQQFQLILMNNNSNKL